MHARDEFIQHEVVQLDTSEHVHVVQQEKKKKRGWRKKKT